MKRRSDDSPVILCEIKKTRKSRWDDCTTLKQKDLKKENSLQPRSNTHHENSSVAVKLDFKRPTSPTYAKIESNPKQVSRQGTKQEPELDRSKKPKIVKFEIKKGTRTIQRNDEKTNTVFKNEPNNALQSPESKFKSNLKNEDDEIDQHLSRRVIKDEPQHNFHLAESTSISNVKNEDDSCKKQMPRRDNNIEKNSNHLQSEATWNISEVLADSYGVPLPACKKFTSLIEQDCTLPFIARYRKEMVGNLDIEVLRKMKSSMEDLQKVKGRIATVINTLEKQNVLTPSLNETIVNIKDLDELEFCIAPFKDSKKKTLAARAKELGLEEPALELINTSKDISFESLVNAKVEGRETVKSVKLGIKHVLADVIGKSKENIDKMKELLSRADTKIRILQSRSASKQDPKDVAKFESYFDKIFYERSIKSHTFLAISRGEDLKILSIKIIFPEHVEPEWIDFCERKYKTSAMRSSKKQIISLSIQDAFTRIVEPLFMRKVKSRLTEKAHEASIDVFIRNLKSLLLSPPLPNTTVLGLDPGFKHGCKCAAVSSNGSVLYTETIFIQFNAKDLQRQPAAVSLDKMIRTYGCTTIALGNGKACRETENFLSQLIQSGLFKPLEVKYTIVNESGASIYSCSAEAKEEFPSLDPNLISAISIARRLQDPLTEYVRVSPQHIGIGMYQHDVSVKKLETALDDVVSECVSFVGVDLNSCPIHVLSKVAGLTVNKAKKIIEYRNKNGPFINRQQILDVPSIGQKTFEQCAGFLTIPESFNSNQLPGEKPASKKVGSKKKVPSLVKPNPLDRTCVHPESFSLAQQIIDMFRGNVEKIGHDIFIFSLQAFLSTKSCQKIAEELGERDGKIDQIIQSLLKPLRYDLRNNFDKPLFKTSVTSMSDLRVGQRLTGRINNVTDFGAFVDIGIGQDALLHISAIRGGIETMSATMNVAVRVKSINQSLGRVGLELDS